LRQPDVSERDSREAVLSKINSVDPLQSRSFSQVFRPSALLPSCHAQARESKAAFANPIGPAATPIDALQRERVSASDSMPSH
jgi:hypothetical protein